MVGVRGVTGGVVPGRARVARGGGGGFSLSASQADGPAAARSAAAQPAGLLALQEATPAQERDARARRHGDAALRGLAELQLSLLDRQADPARLRDLAATLPAPEEAADPGLAEILAAIRLRMRVELARHGLEPASSQD